MSDTPARTTDSNGSERGETDHEGYAAGNRRQFIALGAGAATVFLAGCSSGDDSDSSENGTDSQNGNESGDETGNGNESGGETGNGNESQNGSENGSENRGENGEEEPAPAELSVSSLDIAGQGTNATVDSDSGGQVTVTVENVGEQSDSFDLTLSAGDASQTQTVDLGGGESQTVTFGELLSELGPGNRSVTVVADGEAVDRGVSATVTVEESEPATDAEQFRSQFAGGTAYEFEVSSGRGGTVTGRFRDGNQYLQFQGDRGTGEFYLVDGAVYSVQEGGCITVPSNPVETPEPPEEEAIDDARFSSVTRTGTETIDGEEVIVYDVSATSSNIPDATYYLLADTGRLRRVTTQGPRGPQQVEFLAWGDEVDPITLPEACPSPRDT